MSLAPTLYRFALTLSHVDRDKYGSFDLRMPKHPSETLRYLAARVLAYAIYYDEELAFSKVGLASPDEPTIAIKNPGGEIALWVEVGTPSAERIHRASKASTKMALVVHLEPKPWLAILAGQKIHQREEIETIALDPKFLDQVASHFGDRGTALEVTITDDVLYVGIEKKNYQTTLERIAL